MRHRRHLLATVATVLFMSGTGRADDRAAARTLFEEGRQLMKAGKTAEACPKFEAASHLTQTSGVRLNLAVCWAKLGRTASAWGMYDEARAIAERNGETAQAELAQKGKAELEPKLSRLLVMVPAASAVQGLQVTRDGEPVLSGAWGVGVPVDPGAHEVAARAPERKAWSMKVNVAADGGPVSVTVPVLEPEKSAVAAGATPETPAATVPPATMTDVQERPRSAGGTQRVLGLVAGGVGIVGLGVGTYFGLHASSLKSSYQSHEADGHCIDMTCQTDSHDAASAGNLSTVFFIAGGALVGTGAALWLTAPKNHEATAVTAKVVPAVNARTAGLSIEGTW